MRQYSAGLPLRVHPLPDGAPHSFVWHGVTHCVESVEDIREPLLDWWAPEAAVHRRYYLVITNRKLICELFHDLVTGQWHMSRTFD